MVGRWSVPYAGPLSLDVRPPEATRDSSRMNHREQRIHAARQLISDERLVAFFRAADGMENRDVLAVRLICQALSDGETLDDIFYDDDDFGYSLAVERTSASSYRIDFGCQVDPLVGDGGEWKVSFTGDEVACISRGTTWIS